jgi:hypothetical protein
MALSITVLIPILFQLFAGATQQPPTALIEGVVLRAGTGDAIPKAQVTLISTTPSGTAAAPVFTDGLGRFVFQNVAPGTYRLAAARNGFIRQEYGQRIPAGRPGTVFNVSPGQTLKDIAIRLTPTGTVSGRVTDPTGEPITGVPVQLMRYRYNSNGERTFQIAGTGRTDDRGEYRVYWLKPGRYYISAGNWVGNGIVSVGASGGPTETYLTTYYPGTADPSQASIVDLQAGVELTAIDFFMVPQRPHRVSGRVIDTRTGRQPIAAGVSIIPRYAVGPTAITMSSLNYNPANGFFEFRDVAPGQYWVRASELDPASGAVASSERTVQVAVDVPNSDVESVVVALTPSVTIAGRLSVEGQPISAVTREQLTISLKPSINGHASSTASGSPASQGLKPDGTFKIEHVNFGEYLVTAGPLPPGFYIKEARIGGTDVLARGMIVSGDVYGSLDIVLSPNAGQIEGTVSEENQQPLANSQVVLVPDQFRERHELYKTAITDENGHFTLRGVVPGVYKVFAWEEVEPFAYFDYDLQTRFEQFAKAVTVSESSNTKLEIRAIPVVTR